MFNFRSISTSSCAAMMSLSLLAGPLQAQEQEKVQEAMVPAGAIAGAVTSPVDGDINRFRTILVETEEGADLYVFTDAGEGWKQVAHAKDMVWRGGMYGQEPWMEATEHGSLKIYSENSAVGRNRWEQVLTIAYRNGVFRVAGYTYSYYDTLDPDANGQCDVNLLTGKGVLNGKNFKTSLGALPVQDWTMDTRPPECEVE
ncbi:hypothetical protein [Roseibium aggregatum]|uniref:hypothetical protein n=1 Tax=Roseibium aggregatum TaxID=187304 RepID=UPI000A9328EE|nr:hypothetical protein [Roseibium aggregatum]UFI02060.1 hypothetical protein ST40_018815 [Roseibium aggregatum]